MDTTILATLRQAQWPPFNNRAVANRKNPFDKQRHKISEIQKTGIELNFQSLMLRNTEFPIAEWLIPACDSIAWQGFRGAFRKIPVGQNDEGGLHVIYFTCLRQLATHCVSNCCDSVATIFSPLTGTFHFFVRARSFGYWQNSSCNCYCTFRPRLYTTERNFPPSIAPPYSQIEPFQSDVGYRIKIAGVLLPRWPVTGITASYLTTRAIGYQPYLYAYGFAITPFYNCVHSVDTFSTSGIQVFSKP